MHLLHQMVFEKNLVVSLFASLITLFISKMISIKCIRGNLEIGTLRLVSLSKFFYPPHNIGI